MQHIETNLIKNNRKLVYRILQLRRYLFGGLI